MIHEKAQRRPGRTTALALGPLLATFVILNLTLAERDGDRHERRRCEHLRVLAAARGGGTIA